GKSSQRGSGPSNTSARDRGEGGANRAIGARARSRGGAVLWGVSAADGGRGRPAAPRDLSGTPPGAACDLRGAGRLRRGRGDGRGLPACDSTGAARRPPRSL